MPDVFVLSLLTAIFTMASTAIAGDSITNTDILDYRRQHGSALTAKWLKPQSDCADLARRFAPTLNFAKIGEVGVEMFPTCHLDDLVPT